MVQYRLPVSEKNLKQQQKNTQLNDLKKAMYIIYRLHLLSTVTACRPNSFLSTESPIPETSCFLDAPGNMLCSCGKNPKLKFSFLPCLFSRAPVLLFS